MSTVPEERSPVTSPTPAHTLDLVVHLVRRDIAANNRFSVIGAAWPLLRQLAQLAVLVIAFSAVLDLGIENYPVFVFSGLIGWTWFVSGLNGATTSILGGRALAMRPGFPTYVLPVVAVATPFIDVLFALPILMAILAIAGDLQVSVLLLLPLLLLQGLLMVGIGWLTASASVFFRDVPNLVGVVLLMGFYLTPVYFDVGRVPDDLAWIIRLNPMAVILEADRAALLGTPYPPTASLVGVCVLTVVCLVAGSVLFNRARAGFADEL